MDQPLRRTTLRAALGLAQAFQGQIDALVADAITDGEVPRGTKLDLISNPPRWILPDVLNAVPGDGPGKEM